MNSKLSNKPSKKDRPRSTDKPGRAKRKGDQTPEKAVTPVPSSAGVADENGVVNQISNVLSGEDIDSLAVNIEELQKNRPPKRPAVERSLRQVTVRKALKLKDGSNVETRSGKTVTVAHHAKASSEFNSYEKLGNKDPCADETTPFFEHHILGSLQEFKEQNDMNLYSKKIPMPHNEKSYESVPEGKVIKGRTFPVRIYKSNMDQSNALTNWEKQMARRRKQQGNLAKLLHTSTEMLGMNQNEEYRATQEERHLIDRSIHSMDYGKGYRMGSEFWKQAELIGDDDTGIHMTLTQTERGYPPVIEHVGKPATVKKEMGIDWSDTESYRSTLVHHPWRKSKYLNKRKEELKEVIDELRPHKPYIQELEVIGQSLGDEMTISSNDQDSPTTRMDSLTTQLADKISQEEIDPLSLHPDVYPQPIFGPSLMIAGRSAAWNGSTNNRVGEIAVSCRVLLEAKVKERVLSTLDVYNNGTAAVYFSWKHVPIENTLGTKLAGQQQRFYFDKNSGVILPGDTLRFPFTFKSTNPGMFSEQWQLDTQPVVNGGAAIRVLLKGMALQDDLNAEKRAELEAELSQRQVKEIVQSIVNEILDGVRSPERPASPVDAYVTDEELFIRKNPEIYYDEETVQKLKQLYNEIDTDGDWDLSLTSLRQLITLSQFEDEQIDEYLSRLNEHVKILAFAPRVPVKEEMYSTCYIMLCELVDNLVTKSDMMRSRMGLPLKDMIEDTTVDDVHDKKSKKAPDPSRLTVDKKDSKKDKKGGDRPISSHKLKTPTDKRPTRGNSNVHAKITAEESQDAVNNFVITLSDECSIEQSVNLTTEDQYKKKYFAQAYKLVSETVEKIAGMFENINTMSSSLNEMTRI